MNHRVQPGGKLISMIAGAPLSVAFILCLTTCQASTTPESNLAPKASSAQDPSKRGAYQHIKDCADQAERMVARKGWRKDRLAAEEESTFVGAENHYSSKYDRCYLRASSCSCSKRTNGVQILAGTSCTCPKQRILGSGTEPDSCDHSGRTNQDSGDVA